MDDLDALTRQQLDDARASAHGRSAHLFLHDGPLRQTVIALIAGASLDEHQAPPAASLQVLKGRVRLTGPGNGTELKTGQIAVLQKRHGVEAVEDSAVLLTSVTEFKGEDVRGAETAGAARG
ncbi:cupin [Streptomyces sp. NPDC048196]|uniref:cupin n=1 Tax=Streptomyces sp. NPDC048196 TaxID=3154712 RepID=UPI003403A51B